MNRAGETDGVTHYRADRFFAVNSAWYFTTRESPDQGPYISRVDAEQALVRYVHAYQHLDAPGMGAASDPVMQLEQGFTELASLDIAAAWDTLGTAAANLGIPIEHNMADRYTCCNQVLCAAETRYKQNDPRLAGLPVHLQDYQQRRSIMPFPLLGLLVPERLYLKKPDAHQVFCCKVSEAGEVMVADAGGHIARRSLKGLPLDARISVMMLIAEMREIIPTRPDAPTDKMA